MGSNLAIRARYSSVSSRGFDLTRLYQPGEMRHGQKGKRLVGGRPRHRWRPANQPARPDGNTFPGGTGLNTIAGCTSSPMLALRSAANPAMCPRVALRRVRIASCSTRVNETRELLRRLENLDGDDVGTLRGDGEGLGHEGGAQAHGREAREEVPPVNFSRSRFIAVSDSHAGGTCRYLGAGPTRCFLQWISM